MSFFMKKWLMIRRHCGWGANNNWFWNSFLPVDLLPKIGRHESLWKHFPKTALTFYWQTTSKNRCKSKKPASLDLVALTVRSQACCLPCCSEEPVSPLKKDLRIQQYLSVDDHMEELRRESPEFLVAAFQRERRRERGTELGTLRRKLGRLPSLASWGSKLDLWHRFISSYLHSTFPSSFDVRLLTDSSWLLPTPSAQSGRLEQLPDLQNNDGVEDQQFGCEDMRPNNDMMRSVFTEMNNFLFLVCLSIAPFQNFQTNCSTTSSSPSPWRARCTPGLVGSQATWPLLKRIVGIWGVSWSWYLTSPSRFDVDKRDLFWESFVNSDVFCLRIIDLFSMASQFFLSFSPFFGIFCLSLNKVI